MSFSLKAAWNNKCPRCRQGDMFTTPLDFKDPLKMPENCKYCGQKTEPEIGFYYGAMMVSYGISSWLFLSIILTLVFYFDWSVNSAMVVVVIFCALTYLKLLRFSRSLWLHMMEKHDKTTELRVKQELLASSKPTEKWTPSQS